MFAPNYFIPTYFWEHYFGPVLVVDIIQTYAGAYAIIVEFNPAQPNVEFTQTRGVTLLVPTADLEDAEVGAVTQLKPSAAIYGGRSGSTIERVQ